MLASDVNIILQRQDEAVTASGQSYSDLSLAQQHETWLDAACDWLKDNLESATVQEWFVDILRYDCVDGCGFSDYVDTEGVVQAVRGSPFEASYLNALGGRCEFGATAIACTCLEPELYGAECQLSCPGLSAHPLVDAATGNLTLAFCSGHGECDAEYHTCDCQQGFGGAGCEVTFDKFALSDGVRVSFTVLLSVLITVFCASLTWIWHFRWYKQVAALHVQLTALMTLGKVSICIGTIMSLMQPYDDILCCAEKYFVGLGATATIMAPVLKTYRVHSVFNQARSGKGRGNIVIPDKKLVVWLLNVLAIELALCILYTILHQNAGGVQTMHSDEFLRTEVRCNDSGFLSTLWSLNYAFFAVLICVLAYYSFKVRHVTQFSEAKCSFLSSFGILFIVLLMVVFAAVTDDVEHLVVINALAICLALCEVGLFFWAPRIYAFHAHPDRRVLLGTEQRREHEQSQYAPSFFEKTDEPGPDDVDFRKMNTESDYDAAHAKRDHKDDTEAAAADVEVTI